MSDSYSDAMMNARILAYEKAAENDRFELLCSLALALGSGAILAVLMPLPYPFLGEWAVCSGAVLMVMTFTWVSSFRTWNFAAIAIVLDALSTLASIAIAAYALVLTNHQIAPSWQNQLMLGVLIGVLAMLFIGSFMLWRNTQHLSKPRS